MDSPPAAPAAPAAPAEPAEPPRDPRGVWNEDWGIWEPHMDEGSDNASEDGNYSLREDSESPMMMIAADDEYEEQDKGPIGAFETPMDDSIVLIVEVKETTGDPIQGAIVEVSDDSGEMIARSEPTRADGYTRVRTPKQSQLKVHHDSYRKPYTKDFDVEVCQGDTDGCEVLLFLNPHR